MKAVPQEKLKGAQKLISFARHGGSTRQILWGAMIAGTCRSQPLALAPSGVLRISRDRDNWRIFGGLKFSMLGFCGGGVWKFWQVSSIWRFMVVPMYPCRMVPQINFYGSEIRHGIFWGGGGGLNVSPGIFLSFVWSPRDFLGFWFLPPFDHPCHLKSAVPSWALALLRIIVFVQCFLFLFRRIKTKECFYLTWPVPDGPVWITFFPMCCNNFAACS